MTKLKAVFLVATLKPKQIVSHTQVLAEFLAKHFEFYDVESTIIRLIDYDIRPGVYTHVDGDEWPQVFQHILESDIVLFASPIWWNNQSSLMQRVVERLDEVHDDLMKSGKSILANKVAGFVVTGDSDGAMHIMGSLSNFCMWVGFTLVPLGSLSVLSDDLRKDSRMNRQELWNLYEEKYSHYAAAAAQNISFIARMLQQNPFPEKLLP